MSPSSHIRRLLFTVAFLATCSFAAGLGCSDDDAGGGNPGGTGGNTAGSGGNDAGSGGDDGGSGGDPGCGSDADCANDPAGKVCDTTTRQCVGCLRDGHCDPSAFQHCDLANKECVAGERCDIEANCGFVANTICSTPDNDNPECVCAKGEGETQGVCWRRTSLCQECGADVECGDTDHFQNPAACADYAYNSVPAKACLQKPLPGQSCISGYILDTNEDSATYQFCVPADRDTCPNDPCSSDADCTDPRNPTCDPIKRRCIPGCRFNFNDNKSEGCATGQVCHSVQRYLDPDLLSECTEVGLYGIGKCGPECNPQAASPCSEYDPDGTLGYTCMTENGSDYRCRPPGCLADRECDESTALDYAGYCDPETFSCVFDNCRLGIDARNGCGSTEGFPDCTNDYKCVTDPAQPRGIGQCVEKNCIEKGGANLGCGIGQFCSGEPKTSLLTGELVNESPVQTETPPGECYDLDLGVWCEQCAGPDDCRGRDPYDREGSSALCVNYGMMGQFCHYTCEYAEECPARWSCNSSNQRVDCGEEPGLGMRKCQLNADCGSGLRCEYPIVQGVQWTEQTFTDRRMEPFKVCRCDPAGDVDGTPLACPNEDDAGRSLCNQGIGTFSTDPNAAGYLRRRARYCMDYNPEIGLTGDNCGPTGSCEFTGAPFQPQGMPPPLSIGRHQCMVPPRDANDVPVAPYEATSCPEIAQGPEIIAGDGPSRPGRHRIDQFNCVTGSTCTPLFYRGECAAVPLEE